MVAGEGAKEDERNRLPVGPVRKGFLTRPSHVHASNKSLLCIGLVPPIFLESRPIFGFFLFESVQNRDRIYNRLISAIPRKNEERKFLEKSRADINVLCLFVIPFQRERTEENGKLVVFAYLIHI